MTFINISINNTSQSFEQSQNIHKMLLLPDGNNSKSATNCHLLNLLTKRTTKSIQSSHIDHGHSNNKNGNWPGKYAPSLANISIKRNNHRSVSIQHLANKSEYKNSSSKDPFYRSNATKFIKPMPLIKMGSTSLSLLPTSRSKTIAMMSQTWRTTSNNNNSNTNNKNKFYNSSTTKIMHSSIKHNPLDGDNFIVGLQQKQRTSQRGSQKSQIQGSQFRNSKVCQIFKNQQLENYKKKSMIQLVNNFQSQMQNNNNTKQRSVLNNYVIDYKAFNYIEKVIDNPQKWGKFVHRKDQVKQFMTAVPEKQSQKQL